MATDLRLPGSPTSPDSIRIALDVRAKQCLEHGRSLVILIDNAHRISPAVLLTLEALMNDSGAGKLVQWVLAATPDFEPKLREPSLNWLAERIALRAQLKPLTAAEAAAYIDQRFSRAGVTSADVVLAELAEEVFHRTGGVPRQINLLLTNLLRACYGVGEPVLSTRLLVPQTLYPRPSSNDKAARTGWA